MSKRSAKSLLQVISRAQSHMSDVDRLLSLIDQTAMQSLDATPLTDKIDMYRKVVFNRPEGAGPGELRGKASVVKRNKLRG